MILPILLFQKAHLRSRAKEHVKHLECRLRLWKDGNLDSLLDEGKTIQSRLARECNNRKTPNDQLSRNISKLMAECKGKGVLRLITDDNTGQLLCLDILIDPNTPSERVCDDLLKKHPPMHHLKEETIVNPNT